MSEIKCPVCGSVVVMELSEEQYLCEACGNKFQKHNLSKEFQKTDAHIEDVHKDLKETIEKNSWGSVDNDLEFENAYKAAMTLLDRGEVDEAYERFSDLSSMRPWSYKGWYGKFLCGHRRGLFDYESVDKFFICEDVTNDAGQKVTACLSEVKQNGLSLIDRIVERNKKAMEDLTARIEQMKASDPAEKLAKAREQTLKIKPMIERTAKAGTCFSILALVLILGLWRVVFAVKNLVFAHPILSVIVIIALIALTVMTDFIVVAAAPVFAVRAGIMWLHERVRELVILLYEKTKQSEYIGDELDEITNLCDNYEINIGVKNEAMERLNGWQKELEEYNGLCQQMNPEDVRSYSAWHDLQDRLSLLSDSLVSVRLISLPENIFGMKSLTLKNPPPKVLVDEGWHFGMEGFFGKCDDPTGEWQFPTSWNAKWDDFKIGEVSKFCKQYGVEMEIQELDVYQNIAKWMDISMEKASRINLPVIMAEYYPRAEALEAKKSFEFWEAEIELKEYTVAQ